MAMCDQSMRPDRWRERWEAGVAPCSSCHLFLPDGLELEWKCFAPCTFGGKPEHIEDSEAGHCGMFQYRTTRVKE